MKAFHLVVLLFVSLLVFGQEESFRGTILLKAYNEKGKIKLPLLTKDLLRGEGISTQEIDTLYSEFLVCNDTILQNQGPEYSSMDVHAAQIGKDFFLYDIFQSYFFKFRGIPHPLESFSKEDWNPTKKKFRKKGYALRATYTEDSNYKYAAIIDTSVTYSRHGLDQGLFNYLFPEAGIYTRLFSESPQSSRITNYEYFIDSSLNCTELLSNLEFDKKEFIDHVDIFGANEILFENINSELRMPFYAGHVESTISETVSIESFRGSYVYIDFWASWCKPCRKEMPDLVSLKNHYSPSDLKVLSISIDEDLLSWRKAIDDLHMDWDNWIVEVGFKSEVCDRYDIKMIPRYILLDREGRVMNLSAPRPSNERIIEWFDKILAEE